MPYSIVTNSSNEGSTGSARSPNQVLPMRIFSGLLLRIPLGIVLVFCADIEIEFVNVIIKSEYRASQQERLGDVHERPGSDIFNVEDLNKSKCDAADYQQHRT